MFSWVSSDWSFRSLRNCRVPLFSRHCILDEAVLPNLPTSIQPQISLQLVASPSPTFFSFFSLLFLFLWLPACWDWFPRRLTRTR